MLTVLRNLAPPRLGRCRFSSTSTLAWAAPASALPSGRWRHSAPSPPSRPSSFLGVQCYGGHWQHMEGANAPAAAVADGMAYLSTVISALRAVGASTQRW